MNRNIADEVLETLFIQALLDRGFKQHQFNEEMLILRMKGGVMKYGRESSSDDPGLYIYSGLGDVDSYGFKVKKMSIESIDKLIELLSSDDSAASEC